MGSWLSMASKGIWGTTLRRLVMLPLTVLLASTMTFLFLRLTPGDPAEVQLRGEGFDATPQAIQALRDKWGLNDPLWIQYGRWARDVLKGDLGISYGTGQPVTQEILLRLPPTLQLTAVAVCLITAMAVVLSLLSVRKPKRALDQAIRFLTVVAAAVPTFWLGLMLINFFSVKLAWFPVFGRGSALHLVLPSVTLAAATGAWYTRVLRANLLDAIQHRYVFAARARGIPEGRILTQHVLRNSIIPAITAFGMTIPALVGGSVLVEVVFAWPGLGRLATDAVFMRDYTVLQGYVLVTTLLVAFANTAVDITYSAVDPRVRVGAHAVG